MSTQRMFAVDLGASGGKCFAGSLKAGKLEMQEIHRFAHEGTSFHIANGSGKLEERAFWDDVLLFRNILQGLEIYRREVADTLDSIGVDTWGADGQFFTADGDMLGKVYCYRDHRLDDMIEQVKARVDPARMYKITGIHFQPFNVSNQLLWFARNRSHLLMPGTFYLPVPSIFYYYLGGVKMVDSSWASVTQLMDAKRKQWSAEIFRKLGIPIKVMPPIVPPGKVVGQLLAPLAKAVGLNRARLVAVGSHDTASAFAAAPVRNPDEALIISSGTWSLVGRLVPEPITTPAAMAANVSNEGGIGNTRFLKNCMGTWIVQELRRVWRSSDGHEMSWDEITTLARAAKPFESFIDPDNRAFYNPANMETAIADFCRRTKQRVPADRGAFLRTAYESLALKYRHVNEQISAASHTTTRVVNVVGGGSRNKLLNQFTADALGLPVVAGPEEATAVGNLMVQAVGLKAIRNMAAAQPIIRKAFPIREYKPQDTTAWDAAWSRFRKLV